MGRDGQRAWESKMIQVENRTGSALAITETQGSLERVTNLFSLICRGADEDWSQMWTGSHLKATTSGAQSWNNLKKINENIKRV